MRPSFRLVPIVLLAACGGDGCKGPDVDPDARFVIVLVMDGVRPEESFGTEPWSQVTGRPPADTMPTVWSDLVPIATRASEVWNIGSTITGPGHAELLVGRRVEHANYPIDDGDPGVYRPELPTVFEELRRSEGYPLSKMQLIGNTELIQPLAHGIYPLADLPEGAEYVLVQTETGEPSQSDGDVFDKILARLERDRPRLVVVNLHDIDRTMHYGSEEAMDADLEVLDEQIPKLWSQIQKDDYLKDRTYLVITADHGRHHESDADPPWRHHGDHCTGCRRIPLMVLGPDVPEDVVVASTVLGQDVGATVAALLGGRLPYGEGRPLAELVGADLGAGPSGTAEIAVAGAHRLESRYVDDPELRKEMVLDGVVVSSSDAIVAEAPSIAQNGTELWACWREIALWRDIEATPWLARCLYSPDDGATWDELGWPDDRVGPFWRVALTPLDNGVFAVWPHNPNAITTPGIDGDEVGVRVGFHDGTQWRTFTTEVTNPSFPTAPSVALLPEARSVVFSVAGGVGTDVEGKHARSVYIGTAAVDPNHNPEITDEIDRFLPWDFRELGDGTYWRVEKPTLRVGDDGVVRVGFVGTSEIDNTIGVAESTDGGVTFAPVGRVAPTVGRVMPNLQPVWLGDEVVFGAYDPLEDSAYLCIGDTAATRCTATGSPRISALAGGAAAALAIVDSGEGHWQVVSYDGTNLLAE